MSPPNVPFTPLTCRCLGFLMQLRCVGLGCGWLCPPFCPFVYQLWLVSPRACLFSCLLHLSGSIVGCVRLCWLRWWRTVSWVIFAYHFGPSLEFVSRSGCWCPFFLEICLPLVRSCLLMVPLLLLGSCGSDQRIVVLIHLSPQLSHCLSLGLLLSWVGYDGWLPLDYILTCLFVFSILMFHVCTLCLGSALVHFFCTVVKVWIKNE